MDMGDRRAKDRVAAPWSEEAAAHWLEEALSWGQLTLEQLMANMKLDMDRTNDMCIPGDQAMRIDPEDPGLATKAAKEAGYSTSGTLYNGKVGYIGEKSVDKMLFDMGFDYEYFSTVKDGSPRQKELTDEYGMSWRKLLPMLPDFKIKLKDGSIGHILEIKTVGYEKQCVTCVLNPDEMGLKKADYLVCMRMAGPVIFGSHVRFVGYMEADTIARLPTVPSDTRHSAGKFIALSLGDRINNAAQLEDNWAFSNRAKRQGPIIEPFKPIEGLWDILKRDCLARIQKACDI
jgi:hypothetical protein